MDYLQNHIFCPHSIWGGEYLCRHLVQVNSYGPDAEDWGKLVDEKAEYVEDHLLVAMKKRVENRTSDSNFNCTEDISRKPVNTHVPVNNFKPYVLNWLENNVKDRNDPECTKGWCIGSAKYRKSDTSIITVLFHRKSDAMAFIKKFSKYGKPINYCQYFSDVRKKLNLDTMKYEEI